MNLPADPVVERLKKLALEHPDLEQISKLYQVILPMLRDADLKITPFQIGEEEAVKKLVQGLPLFHGVELTIDEWTARDLLIRLARAVEEVSSDEGPTARWLWFRADRRRKPRVEEKPDSDRILRATATRQIRLMLEQGVFDVPVIMRAAARGDMATVIPLANDQMVDPGILWTLAHMAIRPALRAFRQGLALSNLEWQYSYCCICGADATLGELQGNRGEKHLRCAQCGGDWKARRLECAHCGNDDPNTLTHHYREGEQDLLRVEVCDNCLGYLKVIASFDPTPTEMLPVLDLATIHLDLIAESKGYSRKRVVDEEAIAS